MTADLKDLPNCPKCGVKAYISHDIVDKVYDFGWSVGCPRFCVNDGIHGIDEHASENKWYVIHNCDSKEQAIEKWIERVEQLKEEQNV